MFERVAQARAVEGVASATPLHLGLMTWHNAEAGQKYSIFAIGVEPTDWPFRDAGVTGDLHEIDGDHIKVIRKSIEVVCDEDSEDCDTNVWVAEGDDVDVLHEAHGEGHKVIRIHKKD